MSIEAYKWAWKQPVRGVDKLVLLALANYASEQNGYRAWPSLDTLALMLVGEDEPKPQRKTVTRALDHLEAKGLLHRSRTSGGNGRSTRYFLHVQQGRSATVGEGHGATPTGTTAPGTGTNAHSEQGRSATRMGIDPLGTATEKRTWPCRRCELHTSNESELCGICTSKDWREGKRGQPKKPSGANVVRDEYTTAWVRRPD